MIACRCSAFAILLNVFATLIGWTVNSFAWSVLLSEAVPDSFGEYLRACVFDGLTCAVKFYAIPTALVVLGIFFPAVQFPRGDLRVIGVAALLSPVLQVLLVCASGAGRCAGALLDAYGAFVCTQFGVLFTDTFVDPLLARPAKGARGWLQRVLRTFARQCGGAFLRTLAIACASPKPFAKAYAEQVGSREAFVEYAAKLATANELRLIWGSSLRNLAMFYRIM
jgi:hypothetical protein